MIAHGGLTCHRWNLPCKSAFTYAFAGYPWGERELLCPACHSDAPCRSRRRSVKDYLIGITLLRPWRCQTCNDRFYAWAVPIAYVLHVHCGKCGNMDLQRISHEYGTGALAWLFRRLHFPAYRCALCRNRFFSIRTYRRIVPVQRDPDSGMEPHSVPQ